MKTIFEKNERLLRLIAVITVVGLGSAACADAESREAPADGTEPAAEETTQDPAAEAEAPEAAPTPTEEPAAEEAPMMVPAGTSMTFTVDQEVSTDSYAVGDRFLASLTAPVSDAGGEILLEAGTPAQWVVTQATTEDGQALLAVELESIDVDGEWVPVTATVAEADLNTDNPDSGGETAAKIGVGAAAGALVGQILGEDTESTLKGAGVGAAVGTAVALATRGGSAKLPAGSALTVQLEEPLPVS